MIKKLGLGCAGLVAILVILMVVSAIAGGGSKTSAPTASSGDTKATSSPVAAKPADTKATASNPTSAPPTAAVAAKPQDNNRGIQFGKPVVFRNLGLAQVGVLTTNASDQVKSFTVKATFKTGDTISATAVGAVNDLRPGELRVASLMTTSSIPKTFDIAKVDIDTMVSEAKSTSSADAATKIKFGKPTLNSSPGLSTIEVEVSNGDSRPHSFTVQAVLIKGEELVGVAVGAVNDLAPSATKTATLMVTGDIGDKIGLTVDTMVQ